MTLLTMASVICASRKSVGSGRLAPRASPLDDPAPTSSASRLVEAVRAAFPHGSADTRRALALAASVRRIDAGQMIVRQGDSSFLALVLDGHIAVRRTTVDGRQFMVRIVTRGQLSPVLPLAGRPASADAVALTPSAAAVWRSDEVRSLAATDPGFAVDILDDVLDSYEEVMERLDSLLYQDALRRVARVLDLHADLFFAERPVLSRANLPSLVGTSREMTGRVLRLLESRGIVARVGRDRLLLLDPAGLATAAESGLEGSRADRAATSPARVGRAIARYGRPAKS
ncbi:MAG: family transcriptional regulator, nitrogen oxide reductase regulator [Chloroflexota bacterium]|nr:family transcriptional regulator, nitrogen oxide reductase regulator [Chloroflexota bacterium]